VRREGPASPLPASGELSARFPSAASGPRTPAGGGRAMSVRVVIADDQALVRSGFRMILEARDDMEVVGEAADGGEPPRSSNERRPTSY
jgi:hypothetical protein